MIQVGGLEKSYGKNCLFRDASFTIAPGERVGLIGRNGHGKTTLFRILTGEEHADEGEIQFPRGHKIGYLSQHLKFTHPTVLEEACSTLPMQEGGWFETYKAEQVLEGLGIDQQHWNGAPKLLSGGFQVRLNLAKVLLAEPNLLLLDEPTNYLDIVSMRWLERFLREWPHELLIITHDRAFMDSVITHTMMIHRQRIRKLEGGTEKLIAQIMEEEEIHEKTRINEEKRRASDERFIARFKAQASRARAVQSRIKLLEKREKLEKLQDVETLDFSFQSAPFPGKWPLRVEDLTFGYDPEYPLISSLSLSIGKNDRIGVIGKNGRGKTTLLNLLAGELTPVDGEVIQSPNLAMGYFGQTNVDRLHKENTVEDEVYSVGPQLARANIRAICGAMMFEGDDALKKISVLSGGERSRVLLAKILVTRNNVLLLDEPTNHLDMESVDSLVSALDEFPGALVIVTHSEMILRALATRLVIFDRDVATVFEGTYDDFLETRGWSSETGYTAPVAAPTSSATNEARNRKENRRERAEERAKRRAAIKPLEKKIAMLESQIVENEEIVRDLVAKLAANDPNSDPQTFSQLAKDHHARQAAIEKLFSELEACHRELEEKKGAAEED